MGLKISVSLWVQINVQVFLCCVARYRQWVNPSSRDFCEISKKLTDPKFILSFNKQEDISSRGRGKRKLK
jgi:hypothetical protein